ncbi:MAG: hypothetical protein WC332_00520 [Clostridia bacterium]|jgi:hypothetical protein
MYQGSDRFRTYLNQALSNSGRVPTTDELDKIVQSELEAETNRRYAMKQLALQKQEQMDRARRFNEGIDQMESDRLANSATGLLTTGTQLGTAYLLHDPRYLKRKILGYDGGETSATGLEYRADGGNVQRGKAYIVGEEGAEIVVPKSDGTVLSNGIVQKLSRWLGSGTVKKTADIINKRKKELEEIQ